MPKGSLIESRMLKLDVLFVALTQTLTVAFVAEVPDGPMDESTVLPVLIYKWSTGAERAWEPQTAAAIIVLLIFLILMNLIAIILRRRFERRW